LRAEISLCGSVTAPPVGGGTLTGAGIATVIDYSGGVLIR
jgi:hypothetical protein